MLQLNVKQRVQSIKNVLFATLFLKRKLFLQTDIKRAIGQSQNQLQHLLKVRESRSALVAQLCSKEKPYLN